MPSEQGDLRFGDLVLVPFPYTDQTAAKRRPAVIVSTAAYNTRHPDRILMPVTSQMRGAERPDDVVVEHWQAANLLKPSAIKPLIATVEAPLVIRKLGSLLEEDASRLGEMLRTILGR